MNNKKSKNKLDRIKDVLLYIVLSLFVMAGAVYYASCYYSNYDLNFTQEDTFLFTIIIIAVISLSISNIVGWYLVVKYSQKATERLEELQYVHQSENTKQFDTVLDYVINHDTGIKKEIQKISSED